jgi:hypothetical protein
MCTRNHGATTGPGKHGVEEAGILARATPNTLANCGDDFDVQNVRHNWAVVVRSRADTTRREQAADRHVKV